MNVDYPSPEIESSTETIAHGASDLGTVLYARKLTCAVAESCTGGMIGAAITAVAGSSSWFRGGIIAYTNDVKVGLLGVSSETLAIQGAVSSETVSAMAAGVASACGSDCAVSVSGIAGPGGGTANKMVGLVYIGVFFRGTVSTFRHQFSGNRESVRMAAVIASLNHLVECVNEATQQ